MIKFDERNNEISYWNKADDRERIFVLLARDKAAPTAIRAWIGERLRLGLNLPTDAQIQEANFCADAMEIDGNQFSKRISASKSIHLPTE